RTDPPRDRQGASLGGGDAAPRARGPPRRRLGLPRPTWAPPRRARRELLAIPPLHVRRARKPCRLAPLRPRRPSICARTRMGGGAYDLDLAGSVAVDGILLAARRRAKTRSRAGARLCPRRAPSAWRRARRYPRHHAPDGKPLGD